jgi:hypothetical protein
MSKRKENDTPSDEHIIKNPRTTHKSLSGKNSHPADSVMTIPLNRIYTSVIGSNFDGLNNIIAEFLNSRKPPNESRNVNVRKTLEICQNDSLLDRLVENVPKRGSNEVWPCCSICGLQIKENMHIEHTIPSTLFRLLFADIICVDFLKRIDLNLFYRLTCGTLTRLELSKLESEYSVLNLLIVVSHDVCNLLKGRTAFVKTRVKNNTIRLEPDIAKINQFAHSFHSPTPPRFMNETDYIRKFNDVFQGLHRDEIIYRVQTKITTFIGLLCGTFSGITLDQLTHNILGLHSVELKYENDVQRDEQEITLEGKLPMDWELLQPIYIRTTARGSERRGTNNLVYTLHIPRSEVVTRDDENENFNGFIVRKIEEIKNLSKNPSKKAKDGKDGKGIRKNKSTKTKKNKNNKTRRNNKPYNKPKSQRNKLKSKN